MMQILFPKKSPNNLFAFFAKSVLFQISKLVKKELKKIRLKYLNAKIVSIFPAIIAILTMLNRLNRNVQDATFNLDKSKPILQRI